MPNFYSNCAILTTNCVLYLNSNGTSPVGAGYYSDGVNCWATNSSGVITGTTVCPTPTPTQTPTPTPTCDCTWYDLTISGLDTGQAFGNTIFANGAVYVQYTGCDGNTYTPTYDSGTYDDAICVKQGTSVSLSYYQSDAQFQATNSSSQNTFVDCCST